MAVDGPENGPAPALWDVNVAPIYGGAFVNKTAHVEVPHTATMKPCHQCQMQGKLTCSSCNVRRAAPRWARTQPFYVLTQNTDPIGFAPLRRAGPRL